MKTIRGALAAALVVLTSAMSVQAAEYGHYSGSLWRNGVDEFLQPKDAKTPKCTPESVTGGITGQDNVHIYCIRGGFTGTYTLLLYPRHPVDRANLTIKALVDGGNARILGFIGDDAYVLTWTKQQ
jgi:hypothetical protein